MIDFTPLTNAINDLQQQVTRISAEKELMESETNNKINEAANELRRLGTILATTTAIVPDPTQP